MINQEAERIHVTVRAALKHTNGNISEAARREIIEKVIVFKRNAEPCQMQAGRDVWWHDEMAKAKADCPPEKMKAEDTLFILYTSGSTGKPKGVQHSTGVYLLQAAMKPSNSGLNSPVRQKFSGCHCTADT